MSERSKRPTVEKQTYHESSSDEDPFSSRGDNDKDVDFKLPTPTKKKRLTTKERILRLNQKVKEYRKLPNINHDVFFNNIEEPRKKSNQHEASVNPDLRSEALQNGKIDAAAEKKSPNQTNEKLTNINHDDLFNNIEELPKNSNQHEASVNPYLRSEALPNGNIDAAAEKTSPNQTNEHTGKSIDRIDRDEMSLLILGLVAKVDDLKSSVDCLRKQNARLEAKLQLGQRNNVRQRNFYDENANIDHFVNFESSLSKEGLPLANCADVDDFEEKLSKFPSYRDKLVF